MSVNPPVYPLAQILEVKLKRQEEAEKIATQKREALEKETVKLREAEGKRDAVRNHYQEKLAQLRAALDEGGITTTEISQMREYMKGVKEKLLKEEGLVKEQQKKVDKAQDDLNEALKVVKERRLEVDKIKTHRDEWMSAANKEVLKLEEKQLDEVGTTMFYSKKAKGDKS